MRRPTGLTHADGRLVGAPGRGAVGSEAVHFLLESSAISILHQSRPVQTKFHSVATDHLSMERKVR